VIYLDTDGAFRISQDDGVAVYLPFLNNVIGYFTTEYPSPPSRRIVMENKSTAWAEPRGSLLQLQHDAH